MFLAIFLIFLNFQQSFEFLGPLPGFLGPLPGFSGTDPATHVQAEKCQSSAGGFLGPLPYCILALRCRTVLLLCASALRSGTTAPYSCTVFLRPPCPNSTLTSKYHSSSWPCCQKQLFRLSYDKICECA